eukprot:3941098-Ditylum_brightwellii.AAC.1
MTGSPASYSKTESSVPSVQTINDVKRTFPQAIMCLDHRGRLPIHVACNFKNLRPDVLDLLLCDQPHSLTVKDEMGLTPLMLAHKMISLGKGGEEGMRVLRSYNTKLKKKVTIRTTLLTSTASGTWFSVWKHNTKKSNESDRVLDNRWLKKKYRRMFSPVTRRK